MTPHPCGIDEDLSLADAVDRMLANNIRHLIVLREGALLGVVNSADLALCNATTDRAPSDIRVADAVRGVFHCSANASLLDVVQTMERHHFGCAVVISDDNEVVGIFTISNALHALRTQLAGGPVEPQVEPTHEPSLPDERKQVLPNVRVKRMLRMHNAAPSSSDVLTFGTTGL